MCVKKEVRIRLEGKMGRMVESRDCQVEFVLNLADKGKDSIA